MLSVRPEKIREYVACPQFGVLLTNEDNHIDYEEEFEEVEKLTIKELLKSIDRYYQYNKEEREEV